MAYDLFISYSRRDNEQGQVLALKQQIESVFTAFAGARLRIFFDTREILGMEDWRLKIQHSLRDSKLFIAVLSPNFLGSEYCRWEWEDYVRYEAMRQCLGDGVAPVFFLSLPESGLAKDAPALRRWLEEIHRRQAFDLRAWREHGEQALNQAHVRSTIEQLHASVRERLDRVQRAALSPGNLIKHNVAFVGRVRELTDLREALAQNKLGIVGARQGKAAGPVAVQGLGGMGKTEVALAYAYAFAWDYPGGRWQVGCEFVADLRLALSKLAEPMGISFAEDEKKSLSLQFERILGEFKRRERCLLILDNVSDPQLLEPEYLDRLPRQGQVDLIATTRLSPTAVPGSAQELTFVAVDELPEEDALALMRSHQPSGRFVSEEEEQDARLIVRLLRGFTLAVETAAIYLGRHAAHDACRAFRLRLSPDLLRESEQAATDSTVAVRHRIRSLGETLAFTLATLSPEAIELLRLASLLPADQVVVPWLRSLGATAFPVFQEEQNSSFQTALDLLLGLRLFQPGEAVDAQGQLLIVRAHRLVQELVLAGCTVERQEEMQKAVNALIRDRDAVLMSTKLWGSIRWEVAPLDALAWLWDEKSHPWTTWLMNQVGEWWKRLAEWSKAEPLMRRALAICEKRFGSEHREVAPKLNALAQLLQATNRLAEAEPLMRRTMEIYLKTFGAEHSDVAMGLHNLASLLQETNRHKEAERLMRRALEIWEKNLGVDHCNVASALHNLSSLLQETNRLTEAESLMRRALEIFEKNLGAEHFDVASALNNLAHLLQATNRLAEAEPLMRRSLEINEKSFGTDHPNVARDLNNLAQLLKETNRITEAEPLMRRALEINERSFGADHPNVARDLNNLAHWLRTINRRAEAEPLMRRALEIDEKSYGPNHPDVARDLGNLASLFMEINRHVEAEELMRRALAIYEKSFGLDHPDVARSLNNLAQLLKATNRLAEAEPLMCHALEIDEKSFGAHHPNVATRLNNLAQLLQATNRLADAEPLMRRALEIDEKSFGADHPNVAKDLNNLAQLLKATSRFVEAEPLMRCALEIDEKSFGTDHPNIARDLNNLAQLLKETNRITEAEPLMRRALEIDEKSFGAHHQEVAISLNNLAQLLKDTNRLDEAEPLMYRVIDIFENSLGPDHPSVAISLNNLANLLQHTNRLDEADPLMRRALDIDEKIYGPDHPEVACALNNLAQLLQETNRFEEAEQLMRRALDIYLNFTRTNGHAHPGLHTVVLNYTTLLFVMGRSEEQVLAKLRQIVPRLMQ